MPLCIYNMMFQLRQNHRLLHASRIQLGVFLKACGLTMEDSLKLWKTEFGKGSITSDKFERQYAYNIRHQCGKESKRRNLPAFNWLKVINDRPGPAEHNRCPYREFEESRLRMSLRALVTALYAIPAIVDRAKEGDYQSACGMCFASSQPGHHPISKYGLPEFIPDHPNSYFIEARRRRFGPPPETSSLDEEVDDEDLLMASEAVGAENCGERKELQVVNGDSKTMDEPGELHKAECGPDQDKKDDVNDLGARQVEPAPKKNTEGPVEVGNQASEPMEVDVPEELHNVIK
ncbi:DNA primase large subunit eukaryotic/archaeal [Gracilaria domingensis]|nr:DNA primase large subunit eukaryotic/archaeal [Gracilaria domingensis]